MAYDVSDGIVINPHTHVSTHAEKAAAAAAILSQFGFMKTKKWGYKVRELQNQTVWCRDQRLKRKKNCSQSFHKLREGNAVNGLPV